MQKRLSFDLREFSSVCPFHATNVLTSYSDITSLPSDTRTLTLTLLMGTDTLEVNELWSVCNDSSRTTEVNVESTCSFIDSWFLLKCTSWDWRKFCISLRIFPSLSKYYHRTIIFFVVFLLWNTFPHIYLTLSYSKFYMSIHGVNCQLTLTILAAIQ